MSEAPAAERQNAITLIASWDVLVVRVKMMLRLYYAHGTWALATHIALEKAGASCGGVPLAKAV
jgi:hypothetical protein